MSRLRALVDDLCRVEREQERRLDGDGHVQVPWQVYTIDENRLTVHYHTNALNEFVDVQLVDGDGDVWITVVERRTSNKLPGSHRAQELTLSKPLAARRVIDGATGRQRHAYVPDPSAAWRAFDAAAAMWLIGGNALGSLAVASRSAIEDGCRSAALELIAAGVGDLSQVYRERGLGVPDKRAAAKLAVDCALREAASEDAYAESIGWVVAAVAESDALDADQRDQLDELLESYAEMQHALGETGEAHAEAERLLDAARRLHARGGLAR